MNRSTQKTLERAGELERIVSETAIAVALGKTGGVLNATARSLNIGYLHERKNLAPSFQSVLNDVLGATKQTARTDEPMKKSWILMEAPCQS